MSVTKQQAQQRINELVDQNEKINLQLITTRDRHPRWLLNIQLHENRQEIERLVEAIAKGCAA